MKKYKVVIIGAGIAGITSAIYLKRGGIDPLIIESKVPGGALNYIPIVENYPGITKIEGPAFASNLLEQVKKLNIELLNMNITNIDLNKKTINNEISFDYLIIATGREAKTLGLEGEDKLFGRGISTCSICDGYFYKDKSVIVVGGASSALTEALYLSKICKNVTIVSRSTLKAEDYLIKKIEEKPNIKVLNHTIVTKYNIKSDKLVSVELNGDTILETDGIFLSIGLTPNSKDFAVTKENDYIIVNDNYETNIPYVYAIGDVIKKDIYQLVTASSSGVVAAHSIINKER